MPTVYQTEPEIRAEAAALATELQNAETMNDSQRKRFVALRSAMYVRGIFDPVLVRFDSISTTRASVSELAKELERVASSE